MAGFRSSTTPGKLINAARSTDWPPSRQFGQLGLVARQGDQVEAIILGRGRSTRIESWNGATADGLPDELLEVGFQGAVGSLILAWSLRWRLFTVRTSTADRPPVVLEPGLAESGHAQEHGSLAS